MSADNAKSAAVSDTPLTDSESNRLYGGKFNMGEIADGLTTHACTLERELTRLRAALAAAERDSRRLDWLEKHLATIKRTHAGWAWVAPVMPEGDPLCFKKACGAGDARSAIDAAMPPANAEAE